MIDLDISVCGLEDNISEDSFNYLENKIQKIVNNNLQPHTFYLIEVCESPIEQKMLIMLAFNSFGFFDPQDIYYYHKIKDEFFIPESKCSVLICPQHKVLKYRVDFCLYIKDMKSNLHRIVIECDGHDFHEKTKEQASRDKKKDRELQKAGYTIFRYSGSDIYKNIEDIEDELGGYICSLIDDGGE